MTRVALYLSGQCVASPQLQNLIWRSIRHEKTEGDVGPRPAATDGMSAARGIIDAYSAQVEKVDIGRLILSAGVAPSNPATTAAAGPAGCRLILGAVSSAMDLGLEEFAGLYDRQAGKDEQDLLSHGLDEARRNGLKFEELTELLPGEAYARVFGGKTTFQVSLEKIGFEHRECVAQRMTAALGEAVKSRTIAQLKLGELNGQRLAEAQQSLGGLTTGMLDFAATQAARLNIISATQTSMQKELEDAKSKPVLSGNEISQIQSYMFGGMSVSDKISALQSGWLSMSAEDRAAQIQKLGAEKKKQLATAQLDGYISDASTLLRVANQIGAKGDLVDFAQKAIPLTDQFVHKVGPALASGNLIQIASAFSGLLFGGGGVDPEVARHKEIMDALHALDGKLDRMKQELDDVFKMQQAALKALETVSSQIAEVGKALEEFREEVEKGLSQLSQSIGFLTELVVDLVGLGAADRFLKGKNETDYESLKEHFHREHTSYNTAWNAFSIVFAITPRDGINGTFHQQKLENQMIGNNQSRAGDAVRARTQLYDPAFRLMSMYLSVLPENEQQSAWLRSFVPVTTCAEIDALAKAKPDLDSKLLMAPMKVLMNAMLAPTTVKDLCDRLMELYCPYQEVMLPDGADLLTIEEILTNRGDVGKGPNKSFLEVAGVISLTAIAQLNLLCGSTLLPAMRAVYENQAAAPVDAAEMIRRFETLLENNDTLRRNWVMYMLHAEYAKDPSWLAHYAIWWRVTAIPSDTSHPEFLQELLPREWREHLSRAVGEGGGLQWQVQFGSASEPLPPPEEIVSATLRIPAMRQALIDVNSRLVDMWACSALQLKQPERQFFPRVTARLG